MTKHLLFTASLIITLALTACDDAPAPPAPLKIDANAALSAHSAEFRQGIVKVTDGVYSAVGYGLANTIIVEGDEGLIIVDTQENLENARAVLADLRKITSKPIKAIVYTHNHSDHIFGSPVFAEGDRTVPVYAHDTTAYYINRVISVIQPAIYVRSMRQFGSLLPDGGVINAGIGPGLGDMVGRDVLGLLWPTKTFSDQMEIKVAGVTLQLVHAPGETSDQIFVWLPERKVLLPGDNLYRAFPNLYAIRGTPYRDVYQWVRSLDVMRDLGAKFLVPSHSRPISGAGAIDTTLTNYRDAIQYVHDQTVRGMNKRMTPDELVEWVKLPAHLTRNAFLQEFYGNVAWSVRSVFSGYMGWFSGNATDLEPPAPARRAKLVAQLAGGVEALRQKAHGALADGEAAWSAQLADHLIRLNPDDTDARAIRANALLKLGERQTSANGRSYFLTQALEADGRLTIPPMDPSQAPKDILHSVPIGNFIEAMTVRLKAEDAMDMDRVVGFRFPDVSAEFTVHVRRGVAEVRHRFPANPQVTITVNSIIWKEIVAKQRNPALAYAAGDVDIDGSLIDLIGFLALFES